MVNGQVLSTRNLGRVGSTPGGSTKANPPPTTSPGGGTGAGKGAGKTPKKTTKSKGGTKAPSGNDPATVTLIQPPFSPMTNLPFPMQGTDGVSSTVLQKGNMQWATGSVYGPVPTMYSAQNPATLSFQYNPSTVSYSSSLSTSGATTAALEFASAANATELLAPLTQSLSFSLLFNRIFEVQGAYKTDGTPVQDSGIMDPRTHGCYVDIIAMAQFAGQLAGDAGAGKNNKPAHPPPKKQNTTSQSDVNTSLIYQGPSFLIKSWLHLGSDNTATYYGYVSDWGYQIAAWSQSMTPMTCVINVTFTLLPTPYSKPGDPTGLGMLPPGSLGAIEKKISGGKNSKITLPKSGKTQTTLGQTGFGGFTQPGPISNPPAGANPTGTTNPK